MSDLIRKNQSLIEWKEDFKDFVEGLDILRDDYKGIMVYIDEVPSAEPRKKGKWIKKEPTIKELHGCYYECSKCHKFSLPFQKLNFCPNCGADMREGEEE